MCGIIGYTGVNNAVPYLIEGLKKLEYRGYDSAGIALSDQEGISLIKRKGKVSVLEGDLNRKLTATAGIGHTRWATHGEPSQLNAHPHLSENGIFAVVHNGIIENCHTLRARLEKEGYNFISDTDTEVISQLLERNYKGNLLSCLKETAKSLEGSYALAVLHRDTPEMIICAKKNSPLIVAKGKGGFFIMSDILASEGHCSEYYILGDGEFAVVTKDRADFFTNEATPLKKSPSPLSADTASYDKGTFPHYMLKEIYDQPEALQKTLNEYLKKDGINFPYFHMSDAEIKRINRIYLVACGSAFHAAFCSVNIFRELTGIETSAHIASEFRYEPFFADERSLVVAISQSGETADTLSALSYAIKKGAHSLSVVNVKNSALANMARSVIHTLAGPEIAVATTKAYTCQLGVLYLLACFIGEKVKPECNRALTEKLQLMPKKIRLSLKSSHAIAHIAEKLKDSEHIYFMGRSTDYALSMEGALKMKEISYIHCEAYPAGELKHGTISLIEKGTPVIAVCLRDDLFIKTLSAVREVRSRGAFVIIVTTKAHATEVSEADAVVFAEEAHDERLTPFCGAVPLQLLSYFVAVKRNCDVDKPRNLAKSVTVE